MRKMARHCVDLTEQDGRSLFWFGLRSLYTEQDERKLVWSGLFSLYKYTKDGHFGKQKTVNIQKPYKFLYFSKILKQRDKNTVGM